MQLQRLTGRPSFPARQLSAVPPKSPAAPADTVELRLARPDARQALQRHLEAIAAHSVRQTAAELTALPASAWMFHGTSAAFDRLENRPNTRIGDQGRIDWQGSAIFAAYDPRVALHYTGSRSPEVVTGINLRGYTDPTEPMHYYLTGGTSKEDAMNRVYGNPARPESCLGYLHLLRADDFVREPGLGQMEKITREPAADRGQLVVNRRAAVDALVASGDLVIEWSRS